MKSIHVTQNQPCLASKETKDNTYLVAVRSLALISTGFFLFSSANTTVNSRPRKTRPSIWCFASAASWGSAYWTKPKPRGSLPKEDDNETDWRLVPPYQLQKKESGTRTIHLFANEIYQHNPHYMKVMIWKSKHTADLASVSLKMTWNSSRLGTSPQCIQTQLPSNLHYH